ncbi:MAG: hypothetical protein KGS72_23780, partial [Cyanobacteria bacterium REEB67]|nr:hypothetical protein [Cyanobacteria bacterium REEB67]
MKEQSQSQSLALSRLALTLTFGLALLAADLLPCSPIGNTSAWPLWSGHCAMAQDQDPVVIDYHGYNIKGQRGQAISNDVIEKVKAQIEICDRAPVPERVHAFFKALPVTLVVSTTKPAPTSVYGGVSRQDPLGKITLQSGQLEGKPRPILLHEYLHGVNAKLITDGVNSAEIEQFYNRAKQRLANIGQDGNEYFLKNKGEFFAVTASIYLFGDIPRPPYSMKNIAEAMPAYTQYLKKLFAVDLQDVMPRSVAGASF